MPTSCALPADLVLRPLHPEDEEVLLAIFASTRTQERQQLGWPAQDWEAFIRQQFTAQHTQYMAAYANPCFSLVLRCGKEGTEGEVVGRLYVDRGLDEIRVVDIALLPQHRRQGIGRRLLQALADESDASAIPLGLHVEKNNPILGYYQRLDFQVLADRGVYLYMQRAPLPLRLPDMEEFTAFVGTDFRLHLTGGAAPVVLRLTDATSRRGRHTTSASLRFTGPDFDRSAHATYVLAHPRLGRFPLFLGPVMGGVAGEVCYQAVINQLNPLPEKDQPI